MELKTATILRGAKTLTRFLLGSVIVLALMAAAKMPASIWLTKDQQGDRLMQQEQFAEAAETYEDPFRRGIALYRDGQFKEAAAAFARRDDADSAFNRGDALMLLGEYDEAIASFERAIQFRPEWTEAKQNRDIALARRDLIKPADDDAGGTGGQLEADEIVFDNLAKNSSNTQEVEGPSGQSLSDEELRQLWLQRVQTNPGDFLKSKFAYQLARQSSVEVSSAGKVSSAGQAVSPGRAAAEGRP